VNRPLSAFGALMALLALSMFAVSSTSRSTTVQPPRSDSAAIWRLRAMECSATRGATYIPCCEEEETCRDMLEDRECPLDSIEPACGMLQASERCISLRGYGSGMCSRLITTRVEPAEKTQATWRVEPTPVDCRSHYDPVYDRLIYGFADEDLQPRRMPEQPAPEAAMLDRDWIAVFNSLVAPDHLTRPSPAWSRGSWTTTIMWTTMVHRTLAFDMAPIRQRIITRAFRRWANYQMTRIADELSGLTAQAAMPIAAALVWADYFELMDRASWRTFTNPSEVMTSDDAVGVRSSGWLRHSAASSLYQLGLMLQAAGREIDRGIGQAVSQSSE